MSASDAKQASVLSSELGYPATADQILARMATIAARPEQVLYAACFDEQMVGWVDVSIVQHLQSNRQGEIGGLVVANEHRSAGIGRKLVEKAEEWLLSQGVNTALVRSRSTRDRAHQFYLRQNYSHTKTSFVFQKTIHSDI